MYFQLVPVAPVGVCRVARYCPSKLGKNPNFITVRFAIWQKKIKVKKLPIFPTIVCDIYTQPTVNSPFLLENVIFLAFADKLWQGLCSSLSSIKLKSFPMSI